MMTVILPSLYILYTNDCVPTTETCFTVEFAAAAALVGLIKESELSYKAEISKFVECCKSLLSPKTAFHRRYCLCDVIGCLIGHIVLTIDINAMKSSIVYTRAPTGISDDDCYFAKFVYIVHQ